MTGLKSSKNNSIHPESRGKLNVYKFIKIATELQYRLVILKIIFKYFS